MLEESLSVRTWVLVIFGFFLLPVVANLIAGKQVWRRGGGG